MTMLSHDYRLYYRNSLVSISVGGVLHPFHVSEVTYNYGSYDPGEAFAESEGRVYDHDEDPDSQPMVPESFIYAPQAYDALQFVGTVYDFEGNPIDTKTASYDELTFDNPDLGYVEIDGSFHYVEYRPIRAAKKGVIMDRISCNSLFLPTMNMAKLVGYAMNPSKDSRVKLGGALLLAASVEYKGRAIGTYDEASGTVTLACAEANYLKRFIELGVPGCQVVTHP